MVRNQFLSLEAIPLPGCNVRGTRCYWPPILNYETGQIGVPARTPSSDLCPLDIDRVIPPPGIFSPQDWPRGKFCGRRGGITWNQNLIIEANYFGLIRFGYPLTIFRVIVQLMEGRSAKFEF